VRPPVTGKQIADSNLNDPFPLLSAIRYLLRCRRNVPPPSLLEPTHMTALVDHSTELGTEVARRRTFAIISHFVASETAPTEKLLLYGGAIEVAGAVRSRRAQRHTTSDWMAIEQSRGISITSTVLQFEYEGYCLNLLDTPGHEDFSEDTYRTLAATDSAVMVLDSAKGI